MSIFSFSVELYLYFPIFLILKQRPKQEYLKIYTETRPERQFLTKPNVNIIKNIRHNKQIRGNFNNFINMHTQVNNIVFRK